MDTVTEGIPADARISIPKKLARGYYSDAGFDLVSKSVIKSAMLQMPSQIDYLGGGTIMKVLRENFGERYFRDTILPELVKVKTPDEFLAKLREFMGIKIRVIRFDKNKGDIIENGEVKHSYPIDDFPEIKLKDGATLKTLDGKVVMIRDDWPHPVEIKLGEGEILWVNDLEGNLQWKGKFKIEVPSGKAEVRVVMDSGIPGDPKTGHAAVLIDEGSELTTMQKVRKLHNVGWKLGRKGAVTKFVKAGRIAGKGVAGLYLGTVTTFAIVGLTGGDPMWIAPAITADTITAMLVLKAGLSFGKATIIGAVVAEGVSIVIHSVEAHQLNALREKCKIKEGSGKDTVIDGVRGWAGSWMDMFKLFTSERCCINRHTLNSAFGEDIRKDVVDRGGSEDDAEKLAGDELRNGGYQQEFNDRVMGKVWDAILYPHPTPFPHGALPALAWVQNVLEGKIDPDYKIDKPPEELAAEVSVELCKLYNEWKDDEVLEMYNVDASYESLVVAAKSDIEGIMEGLENSENLGVSDLGCGLLNSKVKIYQSGYDTVVLYPETGVYFPTWPILKTGEATEYLNEAIDQIVPISGPADGLLEVKITNTHTRDITCPGSGKTNTDKIKWEIQENCAGEFIDYSDTCLENPEITINSGESMNLECWTNDAPPESTGPHCARITWCGKTAEFTG